MSRLKSLAPLVALVGFVVAWEAAVRGFAVPDIIVPAPSAILRSLWFGVKSGIFLHHALVTAAQAALGFALALLAGIAVGALVAESRLVAKALYPLIVAFQAMPKVALAPLVIIWCGYGMGSKVALAAVIGFFPILVNTVGGLRSCEEGKIDLMNALGASRWQVFRMVKLPNALPYVFAGMHVAGAFVVLGSVVAEFLGSKEGLGMLILVANSNLDPAQGFAVLVVLGALGYLFFALIRAAQRRLLRWAPAEAVVEA
ncbi:MAG TPA: ABC transporter permease [Stellaceae bacterium]|nr:ABC transporter permease [Stellaceae bacterium]